jgi:GNAT superfamily N-acetyltransferase
MSSPQPFVIRHCDGFCRFWQNLISPAPIRKAQPVYDRLTRGDIPGMELDHIEYYNVFAVDPLPRWRNTDPPLLRRLFQRDGTAIEAHLLGLDVDDRRLRFFREATDAQIRAYVQGIDWNHTLLLGAICAGRVGGIAEALFDRSVPPRHVEVAVSVDADLRGQGLGRFLVAHAVDGAGLLGVSPTSLSFLRENRPIQRIVRSLGGHLDMEDLVGVIPMGAFVAGPTNAD